MNRRRKKHAGVNLFAFQDVMASVIGVLFFVVILMAINIVQSGKTALADAATTEITAQAQRQQATPIDALEAELERLRQEIQRLSQRSRLLVGGNEALAREIVEANAELRNMLQLEEEKRAELERLKQDHAQALSEVQQRKEKVEAFNQKLNAKQKALKDVQNAPNVTYIIDEKLGSKAPWLVEITAKQVRAAAKDGSSSIITFTDTREAPSTRQFLEWAKAQNSRTHYFVILIKPSGAERAETVALGLDALGFSRGTDILPESWKPFQ